MLHRRLAKTTCNVWICADVSPLASRLCELRMIFRIAHRIHESQVCCSAVRGSIAHATAFSWVWDYGIPPADIDCFDQRAATGRSRLRCSIRPLTGAAARILPIRNRQPCGRLFPLNLQLWIPHGGTRWRKAKAVTDRAALAMAGCCCFCYFRRDLFHWMADGLLVAISNWLQLLHSSGLAVQYKMSPVQLASIHRLPSWRKTGAGSATCSPYLGQRIRRPPSAAKAVLHQMWGAIHIRLSTNRCADLRPLSPTTRRFQPFRCRQLSSHPIDRRGFPKTVICRWRRALTVWSTLGSAPDVRNWDERPALCLGQGYGSWSSQSHHERRFLNARSVQSTFRPYHYACARKPPHHSSYDCAPYCH